MNNSTVFDINNVPDRWPSQWISDHTKPTRSSPEVSENLSAQSNADQDIAIAECELKEKAIQALTHIGELSIKTNVEMLKNQKERQSASIAMLEHYLQQLLMAPDKRAETVAVIKGLAELLKVNEANEFKGFSDPNLPQIINIISTVLM